MATKPINTHWLGYLWLFCSVVTSFSAANACAGGPDSKPLLSIVIDDIGYNRTNARKLIALQQPISFAVLPLSPYGRELAQLAWIRGKEVMLHIPMATQSNARLDPGGIPLAMTAPNITQLIQQHLAKYPEASGINNHMGSKLTELAPAMDAVMRALQPKGLYFIDSKTSAQSVAFTQARKAGLQSARRDVFLDNDQSLTAIRAQLEKAVVLAEKNGHALAIGHPYDNTLAVLAKELPRLADRVEIVRSSQITGLTSHTKQDLYHKTSLNGLSKNPWMQGLSR